MRKLVIDRAAIKNNLTVIKDRAAGAAIYGMLTGDGQGVGAAALAQLLRDEGIGRFAVSEVSEAEALRQAGFVDEDILMLRATTDREELERLVDLNVVCTVSSVDTGMALNALAGNRSTVAEAHIQVDTGMGFGGFLIGEPEKILLQRITEEGLPCVLCINKIDTVEKKDDLLEVIAAYSAVYPGFDAIIPISARTGDGLDDLMAQLQIYATAGPQLFPDGMTTDQPDAQVCAEIVREKMLLCLEKEIPHGTAVEITRFTEREDTGIVDLDVTIYCEKASHKGIIIGKHGAMLKRISSLARRDIEKFMGAKVYMETWVKVKENWRDNVNFIRARGYDEQ